MTKIEFKHEFQSGNAEIDRQHQELINIMNEIIENPNLEASSERLSDLVMELITKANEHFEYEEMLLQKQNFPDIENHKKEHLKYLEELTELSMKLVNQDENTTPSVLDSMAKCFEAHFKNEDAKFFTNKPSNNSTN